MSDTPEGGTPATPEPAWHEAIITKGDDGAEKLADFATWRDRAPAPLAKFITDNMTAARAKTDGMVRVPSSDATPEDLAAFHRALGVPEQPDGYEVKAPESMPDGVAWDAAMAGEFAGVAHKIGLTPAQVAALQEFQIGYVGRQAGALREATAAAIEAEKAELAKAFGTGLDKAVAAAQRMAKAEGLPAEIFDPRQGQFWGVDALRFASGMAAKLGESRPVAGSAANMVGDPAAAANDLNRQAAEAMKAGDPMKASELSRRALELFKVA